MGLGPPQLWCEEQTHGAWKKEWDSGNINLKLETTWTLSEDQSFRNARWAWPYPSPSTILGPLGKTLDNSSYTHLAASFMACTTYFLHSSGGTCAPSSNLSIFFILRIYILLKKDLQHCKVQRGCRTQSWYLRNRSSGKMLQSMWVFVGCILIPEHSHQ